MNPQDAPHILVIDDDPAFNRVLTRALSQRGFTVFGAADPENALELARQHEPEYVVLDLNIGGSSGLRLITPLLAANPDCRILVLTGYASIATTVDAIKLGATQYPRQAGRRGRHPQGALCHRRAHRRRSGRQPDVSRPAGMGAHPARARRKRWKHLGHRPRA